MTTTSTFTTATYNLCSDKISQFPLRTERNCVRYMRSTFRYVRFNAMVSFELDYRHKSFWIQII